ncbi:hypothetical protein PRZ48_001165 [Zasmidium cellare]|uniref:NAD-dependent epimerase/dehydratase domain-containing protein n=1 Tax=Zasmidium cellare TaxID=395010 RepID=A0ABR0F1Y6_ZASCE|nr:hypothetical protein PRZ48_001165 [Zasmidium cellare]
MGTPQQQQWPFKTSRNMAPRFLQRLERQTEAYKLAFGGEPKFDPPPYPASTPRSSISDASSQRSPPPQYSQLNHRPSYHYEPLALPPNSLVLVTGANGWQGMHVADQLLEHGYRVRGTVRDADKAIWTSKYFKEKYGAGRFTTAIIPDVVRRGSLNVAVRGCSGVVHCVSVMSFSPDPTEVITPTIAGALNALEAAAQEAHVKRFVYCSSTVAAVSSGTGTKTEVTSDSWNMSAFLTAWQPPPYDDNRAWAVYASSKLQTEQASLTNLNPVLPGTLWGKQLAPGHQGYRTSVALLKSIFDGDAASAALSPAQYFSDVQDSALLHVAALILPDVADRRIFAVNAPWNIPSILTLLRAMYPQRILEGDVSDHGVDMTVYREQGFAEELLRRMGRRGWTELGVSVGWCCEGFL